MTTSTVTALRYLEDRWDEKVASALDEQELLRYRSNLLGSDLRITNFGGGNTSSKIVEKDPLDGTQQPVLWVKGSGGDLGSIQRSGFATLYLNKLLALANSYRGVIYEDEMVDMYPLCTFGKNSVAATPLHGFLPFAHVDHLHPDWAIALAAAANGHEKLAEFNARFGRRLVWLPWQRPGFELGMMLRNAVQADPKCDGVILGGHGFVHLGQHAARVLSQHPHHHRSAGAVRAGARQPQGRTDLRRRSLSAAPRSSRVGNRYFSLSARAGLGQQAHDRHLLPICPRCSRFVDSKDAQKFAFLGTSCPDHFIRTKIRPMYVHWNPEDDLASLRKAIDEALARYRKEYAEYYTHHAKPQDPAMRDANPTVVLIPGVGMFSFGKSKTESRITGESMSMPST